MPWSFFTSSQGKAPVTAVRQAVQTPAGRAAVMALLKDFENQEARRTAAARYDFRWLWEALGLAYPDEQGSLKAD